MVVRDVMTHDPACCTGETPLQRAAHLMVEYDCGAIPVIRDEDDYRPVGVITDRDIVVRAVAEGRNPLNLTVGDCMSPSCVTIAADAPLSECCRLMESYQVRRVLVVDDHGELIGLVAQADIAGADETEAAHVVRGVSQPSYAIDEFAEYPRGEGR